MFQSPSDIAFNIFGFPVYFYGIIMAISIFIGVYTSYFLYKKFYDSVDAEKIIDMSPFLIIIGVLGARLYYCLVNYSYYIAHPFEILNIRQGGLSVHGMIIIGIAALYVFSKVYKMSFLKLLDVFLCASALCQSIGRWGNFFNSEAFGTPTNLPWKLFIPVSQRPLEYMNFEYFHPTFLYESILDLLIFIILVFVLRKYYKYSGMTACIYLILYSIARIFVEYFRTDSILNIAGFPVAQVMSFALILAGIFGLLAILRNKGK